MQPAISVKNLGKRFYRYHEKRPQTFIEAFAQGFRNVRAREMFWGLRHVTFDIMPGEVVGIMGRNGAGKSTLLRLIGGVGQSEEGTVYTQGRVGGFLDLTAGLRDELTGRENIFVSGVISGLMRQEVAARFDDIVAFAELENFIDNPIRTYSTGMRMRLAFAVAAHTHPDILLIDEVLAVGDVGFRRKCFDRIEQFKAEGVTILIVSHDSGQIKSLCDRVLWLSDGELAGDGEPEAVTDAYLAEMTAVSRRFDAQSVVGNEARTGAQDMVIQTVRVLDENGRSVSEINSGDGMLVDIAYETMQPIPSPIFGLSIVRRDGTVCCELNTAAVGYELPTLQGQGHITLYLDRLDLGGGDYFINSGVYEREWRHTYDFHWQAHTFHVHAARSKNGVMQPPHSWRLNAPAFSSGAS